MAGEDEKWCDLFSIYDIACATWQLDKQAMKQCRDDIIAINGFVVWIIKKFTYIARCKVHSHFRR